MARLTLKKLLPSLRKWLENVICGLKLRFFREYLGGKGLKLSRSLPAIWCIKLLNTEQGHSSHLNNISPLKMKPIQRTKQLYHKLVGLFVCLFLFLFFVFFWNGKSSGPGKLATTIILNIFFHLRNIPSVKFPHMQLVSNVPRWMLQLELD